MGMKSVFCVIFSLVAAVGVSARAAVIDVTSVNFESYRALKDGNTYRFVESVTFAAPSGESALKVADGATVTLNIPAGVTVTLTGGSATGATGAGAGIEVPAGAMLTVCGAGVLDATGGDAADGANGEQGTTPASYNDSTAQSTAASGGKGGNGGGGAGAGIGGRGGNGGNGGAGGASFTDKWNAYERSGNSGTAGAAGSNGGSCGTVVIHETVTVFAIGGAAGANGSGGDKRDWCPSVGKSYYWAAYGSGGGGGGGGGSSASDIGGGGAGGGGAGGGGGSGLSWDSSAADIISYKKNGLGGVGGQGEGSSVGDKGKDRAGESVTYDGTTAQTETKYDDDKNHYSGGAGGAGGAAGAKGADRTRVTVPSVVGATAQVTVDGAAAAEFAGGEIYVLPGAAIAVDYAVIADWTIFGTTHFEATATDDLRLPAEGCEPTAVRLFTMTVPAVSDAALSVTTNGTPVSGFAGGDLVVLSNTTVSVEYAVPDGWALVGETAFAATVSGDLRLPAEGCEPTAVRLFTVTVPSIDWTTLAVTTNGTPVSGFAGGDLVVLSNTTVTVDYAARGGAIFGTTHFEATVADDLRLPAEGDEPTTVRLFTVTIPAVSDAALSVMTNGTPVLGFAGGDLVVLSNTTVSVDYAVGEGWAIFRTTHFEATAAGDLRLPAAGSEPTAIRLFTVTVPEVECATVAVTTNGTPVSGFTGGDLVVLSNTTVSVEYAAFEDWALIGKTSFEATVGGDLRLPAEGDEPTAIRLFTVTVPSIDWTTLAVTTNGTPVSGFAGGDLVVLSNTTVSVEYAAFEDWALIGKTSFEATVGGDLRLPAAGNEPTAIRLFTVTVPEVESATVAVTTSGTPVSGFTGGDLVVLSNTTVSVEYAVPDGWTLVGETAFEATAAGDLRLPAEGNEPTAVRLFTVTVPEVECATVAVTTNGTPVSGFTGGDLIVLSNTTVVVEYAAVDGWALVGETAFAATVAGDLRLPAEGCEPTPTYWVTYLMPETNEVGAVRFVECVTNALVVTEATAAFRDGWYVVTGEVSRGAIDLPANCTANLILVDGASLTVQGGGNAAGIDVRPGETLNIYAQRLGTGRLTATGGQYGAGIGGGYWANGGTVTVNGGVVTAQGGNGGAGIGGGFRGAGGTVTVNGGAVTATGGDDYGSVGGGAGIGGGVWGAGGTVTVNGGVVTATGGEHHTGGDGGAGIGGGWQGAGGTVTINGGVVTATGGQDGAGIGGGNGGAGGTVTFGAGFAGLVSADARLMTKDEFQQDHSANSVTLPVAALRVPQVNGVTYVVSNETDEVVGTLANGMYTYRVAGGDSPKLYFVLNPNCTYEREPTDNPMEFGTLTDITVIDRADLPVAQVPEVSYLDWNGTTRTERTISDYLEYCGDISLAGGMTYVVQGDVTVGPRIRVNGTADSPTRLVLCDGATLTAGSGIEVAESNALVICGQAQDSGKLVATEANRAAGIGGGDGGSCGTVTINGGVVTATGVSGAGIGGGCWANGGTVTVNGGVVTAQGATGIGGGVNGNGGTVTVNGGTVTATGGDGGAGIGGGWTSFGIDGGNGGTVTINGGVVTADTDGGSAAGIGCGLHGTTGAVTINGGIVTARGCYMYDGIGGGSGANVSVTINGGRVMAKGGDLGAGIGGTVSFGAGFSGPIYAGADEARVRLVTAAEFLQDHSANTVTLPVAVLRVPQVNGVAYVVSNETGEVAGTLANGTNSYWVAVGDSLKLHFVLGSGCTYEREPTDNPMALGTVSDITVVDRADLPIARTPTVAYLDWNGAERIEKEVADYLEYYGDVELAGGVTYMVRGDVTVGSRIRVNGTADNPTRLVLCDGATLTAESGIEVAKANSLVICGQAQDSGKLIASVGWLAAGIGGGYLNDGGTVTINGGIVTATGGQNGAGIGGGHNGAGGTVTVNGGVVTARGGTRAAGIGGGLSGAGGTVTVNGGTVTATGGDDGAGIGGGLSGADAEVTLDETKVEVVEGAYGNGSGYVKIAEKKPVGPTCEGGTIEWSDAANAWVVTPNVGVTEVTIAGLPEGAKVAVKCGGYAVPSAAFVGFGEGKTEGVFSLALDENGVVNGVPVKPMIGDLDDGESFMVGETGVEVTIKTIPGLVYELKRTDDLGSGFGSIDEGIRAIGDGNPVKLIDNAPPPGQAFYIIDVSTP